MSAPDENSKNSPPDDLLGKIKRAHQRHQAGSGRQSANFERKLLKQHEEGRKFQKHMFDWFVVLVLVGYGIVAFFLLMVGLEKNGFWLEPNVLMVLIGFTMGSSILHSLRQIIGSFFSGS